MVPGQYIIHSMRTYAFSLVRFYGETKIRTVLRHQLGYNVASIDRDYFPRGMNFLESSGFLPLGLQKKTTTNHITMIDAPRIYKYNPISYMQLSFWYLFARRSPCKPPSQLVAGEGDDVCHNEPGLPRLRDVGARLRELGHPMQRYKYAVNNKSPWV